MIFLKKAGKLFISVGIVLIFVLLSGCRSAPVDELDEALQHATPEGAWPISQEILAFNKERENAGLQTVGTDWQIASLGGFFIYDIFITVLLDEQKNPAKIIYVVGYSNIKNYKEYTVNGKKINRKAAYWVGTPLRLCETEEYKDNKRHGTTTYFSRDGKVICTCIFKDDQPWTGRKLERSGFEKMISDISYKEGKRDGEELSYCYDGKLEKLRTFKNGTLNGIQKNFSMYGDFLHSEEIFEDGVCRYSKSFSAPGIPDMEHNYSKQGKWDGPIRHWDKKGILTEEENYHDGKREGLCRKWDENGNLLKEGNYHNGKRHGYFTGKRYSNGTWFWNDKICQDKAEFDNLEQEAKKSPDK